MSQNRNKKKRNDRIKLMSSCLSKDYFDVLKETIDRKEIKIILKKNLENNELSYDHVDPVDFIEYLPYEFRRPIKRKIEENANLKQELRENHLKKKIKTEKLQPPPESLSSRTEAAPTKTLPPAVESPSSTTKKQKQ